MAENPISIMEWVEIQNEGDWILILGSFSRFNTLFWYKEKEFYPSNLSFKTETDN